MPASRAVRVEWELAILAQAILAHVWLKRADLCCFALHSRWFACAKHGPVSMSQPRRNARLALQRERAESPPVEPVSIPLDDDTDSLVSWELQPRGAVCGECSSGNVVHIPCCDYAAHPGCVRNGVCPFCSSDVSDAMDIVAVQLCVECGFEVELDDKLNIFSCCSTRRHLRCMAPRLSAVGKEVFCPDCPLCLINGVEWSADLELGDCVICTDRMTAVDSIRRHFAHMVRLARSFSSRGVDCPFCNQSLAVFARSSSFMASSLFHGSMIDFDLPPSNEGLNSFVLPSGLPRPPDSMAVLVVALALLTNLKS